VLSAKVSGCRVRGGSLSHKSPKNNKVVNMHNPVLLVLLVDNKTRYNHMVEDQEGKKDYPPKLQHLNLVTNKKS
jgi:hypothetical protein